MRETGFSRCTEIAIASIAMSTNRTGALRARSIDSISAARFGRLIGARSDSPDTRNAGADDEPDERTSTDTSGCDSRNAGLAAFSTRPTAELPMQVTVPDTRRP